MNKEYGIALIGAGDRGQAYSQALEQFNNLKLEAVCDKQKDRARQAKEKFGYNSSYSSYKPAILEEKVDIVFICTPAYYHPEMVNFAMEAGKHVISEKPMCLSLEQAEQMKKTAKECAVKLAFGFQYPNKEKFRKVKKVMENRAIGRPVMMHFADIRELRPKIRMHDAQFGNGGPIVDMSCHFFDLMSWFFDSEPVQVTAKNFTFGEKRPEISEFEYKAPDTATIVVEYNSEDIGTITICWGLPQGVNGTPYYRGMGEKGLLKFDGQDVVCKLEGNKTEKINLANKDKREVKHPEVTVIEKFLAAIEEDKALQRDAEDAYQALATSLAAIKSANLDQPVTLEEIYQEKPDIIDYITN